MTSFVKQLLTILAMFLALSACSGKKAPTATAVTASATLGRTGGTFGVTGRDGTRFDLTIPAGALASVTTLSLTAEAPAAGQRFHLVLGPPGLAFTLGTPATLVIQLASPDLPDTGGLSVDGASVPFTRGVGGALSLPLRSTSAPASQPAAQPAAKAPGQQRRAGPVALAALTSATCGTPTLSSNGVTGADTVDLALYAACLLVAVDQLDATCRVEEAVRASLDVSSLLQRIGGNGAGDAQTFLDAATATACRARGAAFSLAAGVTITALGEVFTFVRPMAYWEAVTQGLGASCGGQASFSDAAGALTTKVLELYKANRPLVQDPTGSTYHGTVVEAQDARQVRNEVAALQPPAPVTSVVVAQVRDRAERALVDELLDGPWTACRSSGDYQPLMAVMDSLASPDAAKDVAQYCAVSVTAEAFSPARPAITSLGTAGPLGDVSRSARVLSGSVKAALAGSLRLTGTARALACPAGLESPEALVVALNGHEVQRLTDPSYLGNPLELNLNQILVTAGLDPAHPPASLVLTLRRDGTACGGYWGAHPSPLLTIDLAPSDKIAFACSAPASPSGWDLCTVNPDGTGQAIVGADCVAPAWSHDRRRIAFDSRNQLAVVNADGTGRVDLSVGTGRQAHTPSWSPDDGQLAFTQDGSTNPKAVCVMGANGTGLRCLPYSVLTYNGNGYTLSALNPAPAWSPDGTRIAYTGVTFQGAGPTANFASNTDVFLMGVDGSGAVNLTQSTGKVNASSAAWSPDGTRIAYSRADNSIPSDDIYVTTPAGGSGTRLTTSGTAVHPTWSPDGSRIAYTDYAGNNSRVMIMNADGTGTPLVVAAGYDPAW